ncbi:MAG: hypothetical protein ACLUKN_07270 [Bacilli bacterium]
MASKKYGEDKNTIFVLCADNGSPYILPPSNAPTAVERARMDRRFEGSSDNMRTKCKTGYSNALASLLDVFPTAMDFAEIQSHGLDGESLKPVVWGRKQKPRVEFLYRRTSCHHLVSQC